MAKTTEELTAEIRDQMARRPAAGAYRISARDLRALLEVVDAALEMVPVVNAAVKWREENRTAHRGPSGAGVTLAVRVDVYKRAAGG